MEFVHHVLLLIVLSWEQIVEINLMDVEEQLTVDRVLVFVIMEFVVSQIMMHVLDSLVELLLMDVEEVLVVELAQVPMFAIQTFDNVYVSQIRMLVQEDNVDLCLMDVQIVHVDNVL